MSLRNLTLIAFLMGLIGCLICFFSYRAGYRSAERYYQAEIANANSVHAQRAAEMEEQYRMQEQRYADKISEIDKTYYERLNNVERKNKTVLAALRNGSLRLRERFACQDTGRGVSSNDSTSVVGYGGKEGGLRGEDAAFLIRESERADEVAVQLSACQKIIAADRELTKGD